MSKYKRKALTYYKEMAEATRYGISPLFPLNTRSKYARMFDCDVA
jgi:hypothetical protein